MKQNALQMRYKSKNFVSLHPVTQINYSMVQIIARGSKEGEVNLYARIYKRGVINNAVALGVSLTDNDWHFIESVIKNATEAQKQGNTISIRDTLAQNLWTIKNGLDAMLEAGSIDRNEAKKYVNSILRQEIVKELEFHKAEAEAIKEKEQRTTLMEWIETYISQCESGERLKQKSAKMISEGSIKSLKGTLSQLKHYQEARHKIIDFDDITLNFYDDWRKFFLEKKDKKGNPRPYSLNTIGRHIKNLKTFLFAAEDMKLTTTTDFKSARFSADSVDVENVYLTEERLQEMYQTDFTDPETIKHLMELAPNSMEREYLKEQLVRRTPELLNEAKDIFVVGCLTGQRVSDYKRINSSMIRTLSDGNDYIYLQQEKTSKWIYIPLDLRVRAILSHYHGKLPHIYDQDLNERIKLVGRFLGWRENAGIKELHGSMEIPTNKAFYECIKTHTARRTFATNAHKHNIPFSAIMTITGHSSEKQLRKYLKLDREEKAILAAAEFAKAKEVKLKVVD